MIKKSILFFALAFFFSLEIVSAIECGPVPSDGCLVTQDTTFVFEEYFLPHGISVGSGVSLDCNNATLDGGNSLYNGISLIRAENTKIENCFVENYERGNLFLWMSENIEIFNGSFSRSLSNYGIHIKESENVTLRNNFINENRVGLYVEGFSEDDYLHDIDESNFVDGGKVIYLSGDNVVVEGETAGHLEIVFAQNVFVSDNLVSGDGIKFYNINGLIAEDNSVSDSDFGIDVLFSENVSLSGNSFEENNFGARIYRTKEFSFSGNEILNSLFDGLIIAFSEFGRVRENVISESGWNGIDLSYSNDNLFFNNTIESSGESGIFAGGNEESLGNVFQFNRIYANGEYGFENRQRGRIIAKNNWWGSREKEEIEKMIFDKSDMKRTGRVVFEPFLRD